MAILYFKYMRCIYIKNRIAILFLVFLSFAFCKTTAQTVTVRDIADMKTEAGNWRVDGPIKKYFKDIDNDFAPFLGTWFAQIGTQTFVVTLWKETKSPISDIDGNTEYYVDDICGHYRLVENFNTNGLGSETVIYTSNKLWRGTSQQMPFSINMTSTDGIHSLGGIIDMSFSDNSPYYGQEGRLGIKILTTGATTTAQWSIGKGSDAKAEDRVFNIPTDIILTKLN